MHLDHLTDFGFVVGMHPGHHRLRHHRIRGDDRNCPIRIAERLVHIYIWHYVEGLIPPLRLSSITYEPSGRKLPSRDQAQKFGVASTTTEKNRRTEGVGLFGLHSR